MSVTSIQSKVTGRLTSDPELVFGQNNKARASFSIAVDHGRKDQQDQWQKTGATFLRVTLWGYHAEQAAERLQKGQMVIAWGRIETRFFTTKEGEEGKSLEMQVDDIGPALSKWAPKNDGAGGASTTGGFAGTGGGGWSNEPAQDPWGGQPASGGGSWGTPDNNGPAPF